MGNSIWNSTHEVPEGVTQPLGATDRLVFKEGWLEIKAVGVVYASNSYGKEGLCEQSCKKCTVLWIIDLPKVD